MARKGRKVPQGKFRLRVPKNPQSDLVYPIDLEYTWKSKVKRLPSGISARVNDWSANGNNGKGELLPSHGSNYMKMNNLLAQKLECFDRLLLEYEEKHPDEMSLDVIDAIIHNQTKDEKDFVQFVLDRLKSEYTRNRIGRSRYENGVSAMNMFKQFLRVRNFGTYKEDGIYLSQITLELFEEYIIWRKEYKKNTDATINHNLTPIIKACQYAFEVGMLPASLNQRIKELRIEEKPSLEEDTKNDDEEVFNGKSLSDEQMAALVEFGNKCDIARRKEYIDMFLFAFHACGLRLIDVATLQWSSINFPKKELRKILIKTGHRHVIPLSDTAIEILYRWKVKRNDSRFVFGLVKEDLNLDDKKALYMARINATKCVNQSLKIVGENLNLPVTLTFHVARHSFAVKALNMGLTMSTVSRLLGHQSTDITEKVYAKFLPETLSSELAKLDLSQFSMSRFI